MLCMPSKKYFTEEDKKAALKRYNEKRRLKMEKWDAKRKALYKEKIKEGWRRWKDKQPREKLLQIYKKSNANRRKKYASMTIEQREQMLAKHKERSRQNYKNMTPEQREARRLAGQKRMFDFKMKVLTHYAYGGEIKCANPDCEVPGGAKHLLSLCIDHINGGGHQQYLKIQKQGLHFYNWLVKNNYPDGYQILCASCNQRKKSTHREGCKDRYTKFKELHKDVESV